MTSIQNPAAKPPLNTDTFCTMSLTEGPYILSAEIIKRYTDIKIQRKQGWYSPDLKFVSLDNGVLELTNSDRDTSFGLTVNIGQHELRVSCGCGQAAAGTLCLHAYKALDKLTRFGPTSFLKDYTPGQIIETAISHKKYFDIQDRGWGLEVSPKKELGPVFPLSDPVRQGALDTVLDFEGTSHPPPPVNKETAIVYIIVDTYKDELCPFLLPCLGILNNAGTGMKSFLPFISGTEKAYDDWLTDGQRELNGLCHKMWETAEKIPGSLAGIDAAGKKKASALFGLWQSAFRVLQQQRYVYTYQMYYIKELKKKPEKSKLIRVEVSPIIPQLSFHSVDRGDITQLSLKASVKGEIKNNLFKRHLFFIRESRTLYLLSSLRDASMMEWLQDDDQITVFREHLTMFEEDFLKPLLTYYPVGASTGPPPKLSDGVKEKPVSRIHEYWQV